MASFRLFNRSKRRCFLKLSEENFVTRNGLDLIEIKQQETGKNVTIPALPKTKELLKDGLPYKIAIQNFNNDLKVLCELCGIDAPTKGPKTVMLNDKGEIIGKDEKGNYKEKGGTKRKIVDVYPKHEIISSHVCRRTFATNHYGLNPINANNREGAYSEFHSAHLKTHENHTINRVSLIRFYKKGCINLMPGKADKLITTIFFRVGNCPILKIF